MTYDEVVAGQHNFPIDRWSVIASSRLISGSSMCRGAARNDHRPARHPLVIGKEGEAPKRVRSVLRAWLDAMRLDPNPLITNPLL
jgi:hypothetical protein